MDYFLRKLKAETIQLGQEPRETLVFVSMSSNTTTAEEDFEEFGIVEAETGFV